MLRVERAERLSTPTLVGLLLAGLGLAGALASGIGLPFAFAAVVLGAVGLVDRRDERPWPLVTLLVGVLGTAVALILLIVAAASWLGAAPGA